MIRGRSFRQSLNQLEEYVAFLKREKINSLVWGELYIKAFGQYDMTASLKDKFFDDFQNEMPDDLYNRYDAAYSFLEERRGEFHRWVDISLERLKRLLPSYEQHLNQYLQLLDTSKITGQTSVILSQEFNELKQIYGTFTSINTITQALSSDEWTQRLLSQIHYYLQGINKALKMQPKVLEGPKNLQEEVAKARKIQISTNRHPTIVPQISSKTQVGTFKSYEIDPHKMGSWSSDYDHIFTRDSKKSNVIMRLNGNDFLRLYKQGLIKLTNCYWLAHMSEQAWIKLSPEEQQKKMLQVLPSVHKSFVGWVENGIATFDLTPSHEIYSASQIGSATSGIHYGTNNVQALSYGTATHKMLELYYDNKLDDFNIKSIQKAYDAHKVNAEDVFEMGLSIIQGKVVNTFVKNKGFFDARGDFKGKSNIIDMNNWYKRHYSDKDYKVEQISLETEYRAIIGKEPVSATIDALYKVTNKHTGEVYYEIRDYKSGKEYKSGGWSGATETAIQMAIVSKLFPGHKVLGFTLPLGRGKEFRPIEVRTLSDNEVASLVRQKRGKESRKFISPFSTTERTQEIRRDLQLKGYGPTDVKTLKILAELERLSKQSPNQEAFQLRDSSGRTTIYTKTDGGWQAVYEQAHLTGSFTIGEIIKTAASIAKNSGIAAQDAYFDSVLASWGYNKQQDRDKIRHEYFGLRSIDRYNYLQDKRDSMSKEAKTRAYNTISQMKQRAKLESAEKRQFLYDYPNIQDRNRAVPISIDEYLDLMGIDRSSITAGSIPREIEIGQTKYKIMAEDLSGEWYLIEEETGRRIQKELDSNKLDHIRQSVSSEIKKIIGEFYQIMNSSSSGGNTSQIIANSVTHIKNLISGYGNKKNSGYMQDYVRECAIAELNEWAAVHPKGRIEVDKIIRKIRPFNISEYEQSLGTTLARNIALPEIHIAAQKDFIKNQDTEKAIVTDILAHKRSARDLYLPTTSASTRSTRWAAALNTVLDHLDEFYSKSELINLVKGWGFGSSGEDLVNRYCAEKNPAKRWVLIETAAANIEKQGGSIDVGFKGDVLLGALYLYNNPSSEWQQITDGIKVLTGKMEGAQAQVHLRELQNFDRSFSFTKQKGTKYNRRTIVNKTYSLGDILSNIDKTDVDYLVEAVNKQIGQAIKNQCEGQKLSVENLVLGYIDFRKIENLDINVQKLFNDLLKMPISPRLKSVLGASAFQGDIDSREISMSQLLRENEEGETSADLVAGSTGAYVVDKLIDEDEKGTKASSQTTRAALRALGFDIKSGEDPRALSAGKFLSSFSSAFISSMDNSDNLMIRMGYHQDEKGIWRSENGKEADKIALDAINSIMKHVHTLPKGLTNRINMAVFDLETAGLQTHGSAFSPITQIGLTLPDGTQKSWNITPYLPSERYSSQAMDISGFTLKDGKLVLHGKELNSTNITSTLIEIGKELSKYEDLYIVGYNNATFDNILLLSTLTYLYDNEANQSIKSQLASAWKPFINFQAHNYSDSTKFLDVYRLITRSKFESSDRSVKFGHNKRVFIEKLFDLLPASFAQQYHYNGYSMPLDRLGKMLGILTDAHQGGADAQATAKILQILDKVASNQDNMYVLANIIQSTPELMRGFAINDFLKLTPEQLSQKTTSKIDQFQIMRTLIYSLPISDMKINGQSLFKQKLLDDLIAWSTAGANFEKYKDEIWNRLGKIIDWVTTGNSADVNRAQLPKDVVNLFKPGKDFSLESLIDRFNYICNAESHLDLNYAVDLSKFTDPESLRGAILKLGGWSPEVHQALKLLKKGEEAMEILQNALTKSGANSFKYIYRFDNQSYIFELNNGKVISWTPGTGDQYSDINQIISAAAKVQDPNQFMAIEDGKLGKGFITFGQYEKEFQAAKKAVSNYTETKEWKDLLFRQDMAITAADKLKVAQDMRNFKQNIIDQAKFMSNKEAQKNRLVGDAALIGPGKTPSFHKAIDTSTISMEENLEALENAARTEKTVDIGRSQLDDWLRYSQINMSLDSQIAYLSAQAGEGAAERVKMMKAAQEKYSQMAKQSQANAKKLLGDNYDAYMGQYEAQLSSAGSSQATYALQNFQHTAGMATAYNKKAKSIFTPVAMKGAWKDLANAFAADQTARLAVAKQSLQYLTPTERAVQEASIKATIAEQQMNASPWGRVKGYLGNAISNYMSWQLPMKAISMVANKMKELIQLAKQLDQAAVNLQIVTGKSREEVDQLMLSYSGLAKQLGATTKEVAEAANMWLRQGYDVTETNKLVESSMALSKLGMIEASEATKYLTSMLKGFNLEASDSMDIVSKLTKVDMHYAASAGGIAEALSQTAVSARLAGVNIDNIVGYATEIIETSQASPSRVGNALKTMFSRYGNVKAGVFSKMSLLGGEEGDTSTTENINDIEKVLRKLGISIRSNSLEMRPFEDVIAEVAEKWKTLNSVSKNAVATALGGTRQREFVNILLENYSTAEEISEMSRTSSGTAETKYEAYLDSVEAAQKRMIASWEGLVQKFDSSNGLKLLYNGLSMLIDNAPTLVKLLTLKFIGDRMAGLSFPRLGLKTDANGNQVFGPIRSSVAPFMPFGGHYIQGANGTYGLKGWTFHPEETGTSSLTGEPYSIAAHWTDENGNKIKETDVRYIKAQKLKDPWYKPNKVKFQENIGTGLALGIASGIATGVTASGSNRDKWIKGLSTGGLSTIGGAIGAAFGNPIIGSMLGTAFAEPLSNALIDWLDGDAKRRDEAIEKASESITNAIQLSDSIGNVRKLVAKGALTGEESQELLKESRTLGKELLTTLEGQKAWVELMGALPENTSALEDLNNTLISGTFLEKWKATWALDIINTQNILQEYNTKQTNTAAKLREQSGTTDAWRLTFEGDSHALDPGVLHNVVVDALRQYGKDSGTNISGFTSLPWWYYVATAAGGASAELFGADSYLPNFMVDTSAFRNTITEELIKRGIMTSGSQGGGNFNADWLKKGGNQSDLKEAIETALTSMGIDTQSNAGKTFVTAIFNTISRAASAGISNWADYNEGNRDIRNTQMQLAYQQMAFAMEDETLHTLSLNQIIRRIAESLGSEAYDDNGEIKSSIKNEITSYLKTVEALNSRFNDNNETLRSLRDRWYALNQEIEKTSNVADLQGLKDDLAVVEQSIANIAAIWGIFNADTSNTLAELDKLPAYAKMMTTEDLFRSTDDTASRIESIDNILDKLYSRQGLSSEDINTISAQFAQAGITGDLSNRSDVINKLMTLRSGYTEWYMLKYAQDQYASSAFYNGLIESMKNQHFEGFDDVLTKWENAGIHSINDLRAEDFLSSEIGSDYKETEWFKFLESKLNHMVTEIESVAKRVQAARKVLEYDLGLEIDNLTAQKTALEDINNQREYELTLIKAKQKLEDAKNQKQRVWREGVGWVYESNQEAIATAQKELEEIENRKTISEIEAQIKELQYSKDMISKVANAKEIADLRKEYNTFIGATASANEALLTLQQKWEGKMSLSDIWDRIQAMEGATVDAAAAEAKKAYQDYMFTKFDDTVEGQRAKKQAYDTYQTKLAKLQALDTAGKYTTGSTFATVPIERPTYERTISYEGKDYTIEGWNSVYMSSSGSEQSFISDFQTFAAGQKFDGSGYQDVASIMTRLNHKEGEIFKLNGNTWMVEDGVPYKLLPVPQAASGYLSFPGGPARINEQGTEGIITPQGTLTALPSGTGIVPADITKNVWALGEVAPNLLRSLASLEAKGIINNNNSSTTEDSLIINSLMIKMNADKDFNIDKFVKELKNAADLSRHY